MVNKIISLTEKLVSIKSTPADSKALEKVLMTALASVKEFSVERFENQGVRSALVYNSQKRPDKFKVLLNGHLDIIPGKEHQYIPFVKQDKLYGVGTMDMKASVAALLMTFKEMASKVNYPLGLQLVTDEEIGGFNGTRYQIDKGVRADFVVVGESTNFMIENQTKGILWVKISSRGKSAHGAYPWKGENAVWKMTDFLSDLKKKFPIPNKKEWITTLNLSRIGTDNYTYNKIPDTCEIWLDIRYIPDETDTIINTIKKLLPKGFTLDVFVKEPAQFVDANNTYIKALQNAGKLINKKKISLSQGHGSSDARHFARVNCNAIEFGPIGGGMGTDKEWIDINSLENYFKILKKFLISLS